MQGMFTDINLKKKTICGFKIQSKENIKCWDVDFINYQFVHYFTLKRHLFKKTGTIYAEFY